MFSYYFTLLLMWLPGTKTGNIYTLTSLDQTTTHIKGKNIFMIVNFSISGIFSMWQFVENTSTTGNEFVPSRFFFLSPLVFLNIVYFSAASWPQGWCYNNLNNALSSCSRPWVRYNILQVRWESSPCNFKTVQWRHQSQATEAAVLRLIFQDRAPGYK